MLLYAADTILLTLCPDTLSSQLAILSIYSMNLVTSIFNSTRFMIIDMGSMSTDNSLIWPKSNSFYCLMNLISS